MALPTDDFNCYAEESPKTQRAREKLKRQFALLDEQITQEALLESKEKIYETISRRTRDRVLLKNKNISLFDENQNAASVSSRVKKLMDKLNKSHLS